MWNKFLTSNDSKMRMLRTIVQGILGVLIANADIIVDGLHFPSSTKAIIVAITMAILSPIMSEIGLHTTEPVSNAELIEGAD